MTKRKIKSTSQSEVVRTRFWRLGPHYDHHRTLQGHGDIRIVTNSVVTVTMPPGSTHFEHIREFAKLAKPPFPVKFLSENLRDLQFVRGKVYFGFADSVIAKIMVNYPTLRWWVEADGLVIKEISADLGDISEFDRVAGELMQAHWKEGRIAKASLLAISEKLDEAGFTLRDNLQPAQWKPIGQYNRDNPRAAIKTFRQAAGRSKFVHSIRRRLYVARDRYKAALHAVEPIQADWF